MDFVKTYKVEPGEKSTLTIEGEVPFELLEKERPGAIKRLGANVEIDGFRKGHVPEKILIEKIGDMRILSEMAERALAKVYPEALKAHNIDAIGYPQIEITKIAPENPLGFKAIVAILPDITLPDYKAIAKEVNEGKESAAVTDEDIEKQINDILRQKLAYERLQEKAAKKAETEAPKDGDGVTELPTPENTETHTHADGTVHEGPAHDEENEIKAVTDDELPELTDELVQTIGQPGQFENVADFKAKLKEHLGIEKKNEVSAKHRATITDKIIEASILELPSVLIESEQQQMFAQMQDDLARSELKMEDYLAHIKKTREELFKEWEPAAEKRAKLQLILNEIAKTENIKPDESELKNRVDQLMMQYKDADESRVRIYISSVLTNEGVMKMLESL